MSPTVLDLFEESTSRIHTSSGTVSAVDLAADGKRLASEWSNMGIEPGDRVAIHADNSLGYLRCIAAAAAGRFVLVSVNRRYSPDEARRLVERSGATMIVTDAEPSIFDVGLPIVPISSITRSLEQSTAVVAQPGDPFVVFTTSGTTSEPKMVLHRQRSVAHHAPEAAAQIGYQPDDRVLIALPLCGVFGFNGFTVALASGASIWLADRFEAVAAADLVDRHQITSMLGTDDMFHRMLETDADLSSLRVCCYGRFNPSLDDVVERAEERGMRLTGVYGMSEVQALFSVRDASETARGRERAGGTISSPTAAFLIADPDSLEPVASGESGELLLAGPSLFSGYLAEGGRGVDAVKTDSAHHEADGQRWFRTGDLARAEADGSPIHARKIDIADSDDVAEFMFDQGFSDGLPLVPPTPERVMRMLSGTHRDPRDVVAIVPPNMGEATVEKIAINAVMAGCKPEYLPVVIAAVEAVCTDEFNMHGVTATTMGAAPVMIVNGPIAKKIGMNSGLGALGAGNRANATIGRALRLVVRNVGGATTGGVERSTQGNPMKFTMCFAEHEERSPWEPLHVERGFDAEDSVVTIFAMTSGPVLIVDQTSRTPEDISASIGRGLEGVFLPTFRNLPVDTLLVVCPEHIDTLMREGPFSKARLRERIQEVTAATGGPVKTDAALRPDPKPGAATGTAGTTPPSGAKFASTDYIHIVVAGSDAGKFSSAFHGWATGAVGSLSVSKKIDLG